MAETVWNCFEETADHSLVILTQDNFERWQDGLYLYVGDLTEGYSDSVSPKRGRVYTEDEALDFLKAIGYRYTFPDNSAYTLEDFLGDGDFLSYERWAEDPTMEIRCEKYFVTPSGDEMVAAVRVRGDVL